MQRIKSQSICQIQANTSRPRSKKNLKSQIPQISYNAGQRLKITNSSIADNSLVSIKSHQRSVASSMKNLKTTNATGNININHNYSFNNHTIKGSAQNTSRALNGPGSAISARILKQIIGYSQRGNSKTRLAPAKDLFQEEKKDKNQTMVQVILTNQEINNSLKKSRREEQPRTTLSQNKSKSNRTSENLQKQPINSNKGNKSNNKNKHHLKNHRIVQQFSPMNLSPDNKKADHKKIDPKKPTFFQQPIQNHLQNDSYQDNLNIVKRLASPINNEVIAFQSWKNCSVTSQQKIAQAKTVEIPKSHRQSIFQNLTINRKFPNPSNPVHPNVNPILQPASPDPQYSSLLLEKQSLTMSLQLTTTILDSYCPNQLLPIWNNIIDNKTKQAHLKSHIHRLQSQLNINKQQQWDKKTELFQLVRQDMLKRKEKQYMTRNCRERYIREAVTLQEGLKLRISSQADYGRVVLFNQKVVLTGQYDCGDLDKLFTEMFQNKLTRKFALIAKKQLSNLSVHDSRIIQDFLKKIQQLESCYIKSQAPQSPLVPLAHFPVQQLLQPLLQQIQSLSLQTQQLQTKISQYKQQLQEVQRNLAQADKTLAEYVKTANESISGQYRAMEGCSYDFQGLIQQKLKREFQDYQVRVRERDQILEQIRDIQHKIALVRKRQVDAQYDEIGIFNYQTLHQNNQSIVRQKKKDRKSNSLTQTPQNKNNEKPIRPYQGVQQNFNSSNVNQDDIQLPIKRNLQELFHKKQSVRY